MHTTLPCSQAQAGPQSRLSRTSLGNWSGAASASEPTTAANSVQDSESGEEGEASWPVEQGVPPELPEAMSPVAEGAWPFPVSEGLEQFFSDAVCAGRPSMQGRTCACSCHNMCAQTQVCVSCMQP